MNIAMLSGCKINLSRKLFLLTVGVLLIECCFPSSIYCRQWTSNDGKFTVEADLLEQQGDQVKLKKADGKVIQVLVSKLSKSDQEFINKQPSLGKTGGVDESKRSNAKNIRTFVQLAEATKTFDSPKLILRRYKEFIADETIDKDQRDAVSKQVPIWENRINKNMIHVGINWVEPAEALKQKDKAKNLVDEALQLTEVNQGDLAIKKLVEASNIYPNDIKATFLLGLNYALLRQDSVNANKYFNGCINRCPDHISALNNLALTNVRLKKYSNALVCWRTALSIAPATPEIIQNLGRLMDLAGKRRLNVPASTISEIGGLYASASAANKQKFDSRRGWLYMCYYQGQRALCVSRAR